MARREFLFDDLLAFENPVHSGIEIVFAGIAHPQDFGQCGCVPPQASRQLRLRFEDPGDYHGHDQIPLW